MPSRAAEAPEARRAGPRPPPRSNTKCYYTIDGQLLILFFTIICFYTDVRKGEIKVFQKKIPISRGEIYFLLNCFYYSTGLSTYLKKKKEGKRERERKERFEQSASEWRKSSPQSLLSLSGAFPQGAARGLPSVSLSELKAWN